MHTTWLLPLISLKQISPNIGKLLLELLTTSLDSSSLGLEHWLGGEDQPVLIGQLGTPSTNRAATQHSSRAPFTHTKDILRS